MLLHWIKSAVIKFILHYYLLSLCDEGKVDVLTKKRGLKQSKKALIDKIVEDKVDKSYGIVAAYTYNKGNVDSLIEMLPDEYKGEITVYDDLCSSIACHWGPNAFGFIYVKGV